MYFGYFMKIRITKHAKDRFRERFRLQFHSEIFKGGRENLMIEKLFTKSSSVDFSLMMKSGEYNSVCIKHRKKVRLNQYKNMVFVWCEYENTKHVITVIRTPCVIGGVLYKQKEQ